MFEFEIIHDLKPNKNMDLEKAIEKSKAKADTRVLIGFGSK